MTPDPTAAATRPAIWYGQCWEDADVLLDALDIQEGDTCLSIASAGDNTLAMLVKSPALVLAVDSNAAQLACLSLRIAAFRSLEHHEVLELLGSRPSQQRWSLYQRCRAGLAPEFRAFWDSRERLIDAGIGAAGRLERYFRIFRSVVLPLVHSRGRVDALLAGGIPTRRNAFYREAWDTTRWRLLFRLFFSRALMGVLGRRRRNFRFVRGGIASELLDRTGHALTALDPAENPYLQWILTGFHPTALPLALRPQYFETIRGRLDRVELHHGRLQDFLHSPRDPIDRFNLSDVFEYLSDAEYTGTLEQVIAAGGAGARLAYWNLFVPRSRPEALGARLRSLDPLARALSRRDKAFFYRTLVVEEVSR